MLKLISFLFLAIYGFTYALDCGCFDREVTCETSGREGTTLVVPECPGVEVLRSMGTGFVTGVKTPVPAPVRKVLMHRTTMDCQKVISIFGASDVTLNQNRCTMTSTTLTTRSLRTPGGRPPAKPVDDDDDDDDDDNDDDEETTTGNTATTNSTTSAPSTVSTTAQSQPVIVIRGHVELTWGLFISFVVVIGVGFVIVVLRMRMRRRRTEQPVQLAEVSSTTCASTDYHLRSPRRRRASTTSLESVSLFAVNEHQD